MSGRRSKSGACGGKSGTQVLTGAPFMGSRAVSIEMDRLRQNEVAHKSKIRAVSLSAALYYANIAS